MPLLLLLFSLHSSWPACCWLNQRFPFWDWVSNHLHQVGGRWLLTAVNTCLRRGGPRAIPGLVIVISVMAFNLLGDGLRDALDPQSYRS